MKRTIAAILLLVSVVSLLFLTGCDTEVSVGKKCIICEEPATQIFPIGGQFCDECCGPNPTMRCPNCDLQSRMSVWYDGKAFCFECLPRE